jgi:hypothetical protein
VIRGWLRSLAVLSTLLFLAGCGDKVSIISAYGGPREYVDKANMFLATALTLLAQGPTFWGQTLRSAYYSALTLARVKSFRNPIKNDKNFHERVWAQSPAEARQYFKNTLRKVRGRHDYDIVFGWGATAADDLASFALESMPAYEVLINEAAATIDGAYAMCVGDKNACSACRHEHSDGCARISAREGIASCRAQYVDLVTRAKSAIIANAHGELG